MEAQVEIELAKLQAQEIIAPVSPGGVMIASPVVWQRKKEVSFTLCADIEVHVNDKIVTENYPTWKHSRAGRIKILYQDSPFICLL